MLVSRDVINDTYWRPGTSNIPGSVFYCSKVICTHLVLSKALSQITVIIIAFIRLLANHHAYLIRIHFSSGTIIMLILTA